jgi:hypothetical protein
MNLSEQEISRRLREDEFKKWALTLDGFSVKEDGKLLFYDEPFENLGSKEQADIFVAYQEYTAV